jgi:hypothetical protein
MRLNGNQAMARFIAAATVLSSTSQLLVSARVGSGKESSSSSSSTTTNKQNQRRAPSRKGFDPTAPIAISVAHQQPMKNKQPKRESSSYMDDHHYDRPTSKSIDDTLKIQAHHQVKVKVDIEGRIRNATNNTTNRTTMNMSSTSNNNNNNNNETEPAENGCYNHPDTGVLICPKSPSSTPTIAAAAAATTTTTATASTSTISKKETTIDTTTSNSKPKTTGKRNRTPKTTPTTADTTTTTTTATTTSTTTTHNSGCMIGYYGTFGDNQVPMPASDYLKDHVSKGHAHEEFGIVFDSSSNTVFCNQHYNVDEGDYSCAFLIFKGCNVKCNGKQSCLDSIIEDSPKIECDGYQSCYGAHLDADIISCDEEESCRSSIIGDKQLVSTLDCRAYNSCSWSKTYQVNDVLCSGPFSCYGAQLSGVESKVTCQSTPHPDNYYMPVCGGNNAFIEASEDKNIDVTCSGDFACIGYGHNAYDHEEHAIYFDIDVGRKGELICENSLEGNHDGGTYVCRYIDIIQGCANYECHEPLGFTEENDYRTCNHIFSVHHHELCYEGPGINDDDDDDDDDNIIDTAPIKISRKTKAA